MIHCLPILFGRFFCIIYLLRNINNKKSRKEIFMRKETKNTALTFIIASIFPLAVGGLAAFLTRNNMNIYEEIKTPPLSPPSILFPIAWTILYILMGISSAIIRRKREENKAAAENALLIYAASLVFNFIWSLIFFNFKMYLFSFIWLAVLLALIILTIIKYRRLSPPAAYLQLPYALWVAFAGYLNFGIYLLNR